jgi:EAL domain-containing protein (putative c-di-GMP-specific phosphodiesterase class I)/GGDEF domain-containing protein
MRSSAGSLSGIQSLKHFQSGGALDFRSVLRDDEVGLLIENCLSLPEHLTSATPPLRREQFLESLRQLLKSSGSDEGQLAVSCISLGRMQWVNERLGRAAGDSIVRYTSFLLQNTLGPDALISHLGGVEFAIAYSISHEIFASATSSRLSAVFSSAMSRVGLPISAHLGLSISPADDTDPVSLLNNAVMAARVARQKGSSTVERFNSEQRIHSEIRNDLAWFLPGSIERDEMFLVYQPVVNLKSGNIVRQEALARWQHPTRGLISPADFIPLAEEDGFITTLDTWALHKACAEVLVQGRHNAGFRCVPVSVNVSALQFSEPNFVRMVAAVLEDAGGRPHLIELELTESSMITNLEATRDRMNELRSLGVTIALDDFGVGYASLDYLRELPLDAVKIDRTFFHNIDQRPQAVKILKAITHLSHDLGMRVTAEGIETDSQLHLITEMGVDEAQGYLLGRPEAKSGSMHRRF